MRLLVTGAFNCTEEQKLNIEKLGFDIMFQQMENEPLSEEMFEADAVICNGLFLYNDIDKFPNLKIVQLTSAGLDRVPVERMKEREIQLYNARGVYSIPMAEWAVSGVLSLYKSINTFYDNQKNHQWVKNKSVKELAGSKVCVVGCGSVGTECAKRFKAFDTVVVGADIINPQSDFYDKYYSMENIEEAVSDADIVVLTLPLTEKTKGMFSKELLAKFKSDAILVNIARGQIVNEKDLIFALENNKLGGAVLDVFENEPLSEDSPLWNMKNAVITPHNSYASHKNQERLYKLIYNNFSKYIKGEAEK